MKLSKLLHCILLLLLLLLSLLENDSSGRLD
jgi:hypothetical protein